MKARVFGSFGAMPKEQRKETQSKQSVLVCCRGWGAKSPTNNNYKSSCASHHPSFYKGGQEKKVYNAFPTTYPLLHAHCKLYPQVLPVISQASPTK